MSGLRRWKQAALIGVAAALPALAQALPDRFTDPEDGHLDLSKHLLEQRGFLPVPLIITEPAVGGGGGAALLFFRESIVDAQTRSRAAGQRASPPDIGGLAAFKTGNGSQGFGAGYFGTLADDRYRFFGAAGKADLNLDLYGLGGAPRRFALSAPFGLVQGLARLGASDWFVGARYVYVGSSVRFAGATPVGISDAQLDAHIGRASLVVDHDSRDTMFTPSRGTYVELDLGAARPELGSTASFETATLRAYTWLPIGRSTVLGLRGDGQATRGDVPFYARPFIAIRGIPALRYQGRHTLVAEAELRHNLNPRWAVVGFAGSGKAYASDAPFARDQTAGAVGAGFRYLMARKMGLYAGVDVARGPEDTVVYLQVGSAWN